MASIVVYENGVSVTDSQTGAKVLLTLTELRELAHILEDKYCASCDDLCGQTYGDEHECIDCYLNRRERETACKYCGQPGGH